MGSQTDNYSRLIEEILGVIKESEAFFLIGHQNPDADVIGSQLAVGQLIMQMGGIKKYSWPTVATPQKISASCLDMTLSRISTPSPINTTPSLCLNAPSLRGRR